MAMNSKNPEKNQAIEGKIVRQNKPVIQRAQLENYMRVSGITWYDVKKAYFEDETLNLSNVAQKFNLPVKKVTEKANNENWSDTRQLIHKKAEQQLEAQLVEKLALVKLRHSKIGKLLQKHGIEAIEKGAKPKSAKDAVKFAIEGIRIEREAEGIENQQRGGVVNIITQQQAIQDQYKVKDGTE